MHLVNTSTDAAAAAVTTVQSGFHGTEHLQDDALLSTFHLASSLVRAGRELGVDQRVTNGVIASACEAITRQLQTRIHISNLHRDVARLAQRIGVDVHAFGCAGDPEDLREMIPMPSLG